jgi:hypothetical protein
VLTSSSLFIKPEKGYDNPNASGTLIDSNHIYNLTAIAQDMTTYNGTQNSYNTVVNDALGTITLSYTGKYRCEVLIDSTSNVVNREVTLNLKRGSTNILSYGYACDVGATNRGSASFTFLFDGTAGDVYSMAILADGNCALTVNTLQFNITSNYLAV